MSLTEDYLKSQQAEANKNLDNMLRNLSAYSSNQRALQALGQQDQSKPKRGLGSSIMNILGIPGRLAQAGFQELTGTAGQELQKVSGLEELGAVIRGDVDTGFGQTAGLKVREGDNTATRIGKMLSAFALDVAFDPLSYVGAPASISRKQAATLLTRTAKSPGFLDDVIKVSSKGEGIIDDLVSRAPKKRLASLQDSLKLAAEQGTPLDIVSKQGRRALAQEQLADELATTFYTRGRQGLVKQLETLTGSRNAALSTFKKLPEDVRGGIVLTSITGKPLQRGGQYVRLTPGTGESLGKFGEKVNDVRQVLGIAANPVTRAFGGQAGDILAEVKRAGFAKRFQKLGAGVASREPGADRFIDFVSMKDSIAERVGTKTRLSGKVLAATSSAMKAADAFDGAERQAFDDTMQRHFFSPALEFNDTVAGRAEIAGFKAAEQLRKRMTELYDEAKSAGIEIGNRGPDEYSPLIMTDEAYARRSKVGSVSGDNRYVPQSGRRSMVEFEPNEELAISMGYRDPDMPGRVFLNAKAVNDRLEEAAIAAGKSAEEAKLAREFIEDPIMAMSRYGEYVSKAVANKRFVDGLIATGTLVRNAPETRVLLNELDSAGFLSSLTGVSPALKKYAEERLAKAKSDLSKVVDVSKLEDIKARIAVTRKQAIDAANIARTRVDELSMQVSEASAEIAEVAPSISAIKRQLKNYTETVQRSGEELAERQRAAKNVRARLATARRSLNKKENLQSILTNLEASASSPVEQAYYRELLQEVDFKIPDVKTTINIESELQRRITAELDDIKALRESARNQGAQDIEQQILSYEAAVTKRNGLIDELKQARQARNEAIGIAGRARRTIALEQINNLNTLVTDYADAMSELKLFKTRNPITRMTDDVTKASIKEETTRLKELVDQKKKILKDVLKTGKSEFMQEARVYADELLQAADKLSNDQFQSLLVLTNEEDLLRYIDTVQNGARDESVVQQAMGDIYRSYEQIRNILPKNVFESLTKAQRAMLSKSNLEKLKAGVVRVEKEPGRLAEGLVKQGYKSVTRNAATEDLFATLGVSKVLDDIYKTVENPDGWRKFVADYIDPILQAWKTAITIGRGPGYTVNNMIGGMFMNYLGNVSSSDLKLASHAALKVRQIVKSIELTNPEKSYYEIIGLAEKEAAKELNKVVINGVGLGDLFADFTQRGGFYSTDIATTASMISQRGIEGGTEAFRRGNIARFQYAAPAATRAEQEFRNVIDFAMTNRVQRALNDYAQTSELMLRFSAYIDGFRRYGDAGAAMDKVYALHFNYQDLSGFEQTVRRLVPFYTWTRNNLPAQLRAMVLQPGKIQRFLYAQENFEKAFGAEGGDSWMNQVLPEYMAISDGFVSKFKAGDNNIGFFLKLPFEDVNKFLEADFTPVRGRELINSLGLVSTPIELASGVDLSTGAKLEDLGISPFERLFSDIVPQADIARRGLAGLGYVTDELTGREPFGSLYNERQREGGLTSLLNLLGVPGVAGQGISTITPKTISGELARRSKSQRNQIKETAKDLNVDVEWLREQLQSGVSPEQLAIMIRSGMGQVSATPAKSTMKKETRERYLDLLENL
jgi:gas vesicle protein